MTATRLTGRVRLLSIAVAVSLLALSACAEGDDDGDVGASGPTSVPAATTDDTVPALPEDEVELAAEAYAAGYPLVVSTRTMQRLGGLLGVNQLTWQSELAGPQSRVIVAPNRDTLYSVAVLDLRAGPLVLTLPEVSDRYYTYQFLDAWTESFAYVGTRATGGRAGTWVIAGPDWEGDVPPDAELITATTPQVFLLGRYLVDDEADVAGVMAIRDQSSLVPLAGSATGPLPPLGEPAGPAQDIPTDATFFTELDAALAVNPPTTDYQREVFDAALDLPDHVLDEGATEGAERLREAALGRTDEARGFNANLDVGRYGDDLALRALVARIGWGANVPEEAVYPLARTDTEGDVLDGARTYRITFPADGLPPVEAFWSLSAYGGDMFFAPHPSGRYTIGDRTPGLVYGADGSLEIVLAHEDPGDPSTNWLPVPEGPFVLMLRLYLPTDEVLDGTYTYPDIEPFEP
jgi:hypothetical protein